MLFLTWHASHRNRSLRAVLPSSLDQASISPRSNGAPIYDKAYLSELKASTPTARPPLPERDSHGADISMDADDFSTQTIETVDVFGTVAYFSSTACLMLTKVLLEESETAIPSESSILASKQKRERLRDISSTGQEDYISLSVAKQDDQSRGPHPESRLMREEDELGEGDDGECACAFSILAVD